MTRRGGDPQSNSENGDTARRPATYGRRRGRRLRPGRKALLDRLLPKLAIGLPAAGVRLDPGALFAEASAGASGAAQPPPAIWLEIGFGAGEHLAWQAERHPDVGLIGAEVFVQGVAALLDRVRAAGLGNVRIFHGDGRDLLDALPAASIDRVFILFPDPWPKTRHHKRRIVGGATLDRLAEVMKDGVELRLATDDMGYARWMLERLIPHPSFEWLARSAVDWRRRPPDWPPTRYETKALAQGRQPVYLSFRRRRRSPRDRPAQAEKSLANRGDPGLECPQK